MSRWPATRTLGWCVLALLAAAGLVEARSTALLIGGRQLLPEAAPLVLGDEVLVWLRDLERSGLGAARWDASARLGVLVGKRATIELPAGGKEATIWRVSPAGRPTAVKRPMPHPPVVAEGKLMVPLRFVCDVLGVSMKTAEPEPQTTALSVDDHPDPEAPGSITGAVQFAGRPRPGIVLRLVRATDSSFVPERRAVTGADGRYAFSGVPAGAYRVYCYVDDNPDFFNRETAAVTVAATAAAAPAITLGRVLRPVTPRPGAHVPVAEQIPLEWTPCPEAASYELSVVDPDSREELVMKTSREAKTTVSGGAFTLGRRYRWRVLALSAEGGFLGSTPGAGGVPWTFVMGME